MAVASRARAGRAFTFVELLVILIVLVVAMALILPNLGRSTCCMTPQIKCSANLRGIGQGLVLFAQNNKDQYPLPSLLDAANNTTSADPSTKDTTANIISTLIYGTFFGPEICVSPAESNPNIVMDNDYYYTEPKTAVNPKLAIWDPAFSADFTASTPSNFSYAHLLPSGPRLANWSNTFQASQAILGNRGPLISGVTKGKSGKVTPTYNTASATLVIHGPPKTWEGNIAYNDNHVNYETTLWGDDYAPVTYTDTNGNPWNDLLHYDEPDDQLGTNNFLSIFTTSGKTPGEFKPIWD